MSRGIKIKTVKKKIISFLFVLFSSVLAYAAPDLGSPFHVEWDSAPLKVKAGSEFNLVVKINIPPDHFIYADKTDFDFRSLEGVRVDGIKFPKTVKRLDPYFGKEMNVYEGEVEINIKCHVPQNLPVGEKEVVSLLSFQGCSPKLCLRPEEYEISFNIDIEETAQVNPSSKPDKPNEVEGKIGSRKGIMAFLKSSDFGLILDRGFLFTVVIVFLAGVLVSLTPCVWPVIPVVLLIIGIEAKKKWWRNLLLAISLVAGIVIVNASLGLAAAALGKNAGFLFQQRWFLFVVVAFFVLMSLSMFGLFEFGPLRRFQKYLEKLGGKGIRGAFLAGLGIGFVSSPCASPVLAALLGYVAVKQDYILGFFLLLVFGLGMGSLFIVVGSFFGVLANRIRGGLWMKRVKQTLGILLLLPALFYFKSLVGLKGDISSLIDSNKPRVEWVASYEDGLRFAADSGRPILLEFYTAWCPPCLGLDTNFFSRDEIVKLSYQMVPVRIDATTEKDENNKIISKYKVIGWPTVFFLSPGGKPYNDLTVVSYDPDAIEKNMREAIIRTGKQK